MGTDTREPSRVRLLDLYNRSIDVRQLRMEAQAQHRAQLAVSQRDFKKRLPTPPTVVSDQHQKRPTPAIICRFGVPA